MELSQYGVWTSPRTLGDGSLADAAKLAEELGFGALWIGGSPRLPATREALAATSKLTLATGIVNVWQYEPDLLAREFHELEDEFPGRLLLGLGIGHPEATSEYQTPLAKMQDFFAGLAAATPPVPRERMITAALGPKMLDLSLRSSLGTHPYFTPVQHTQFARERLGSAAVIAPEIAVSLDPDSASAKAAAQAYAKLYFGLTNYTNNLKRFGWSDEDFADGGSDRILEALIPHTGLDAAVAMVRAHLGAGADHVCVQTIGVSGVPTQEWTALARALIG